MASNAPVAEGVIVSFLDFSKTSFKLEDFTIEKEFPITYKCPDNISFYDFNVLVQHACGEPKSSDCYGIFKSSKLSYYCYQDPNTVHNIIGQTNQGQKFSVYTLDDLDEKVYLRINNRIDVKEFAND